MKWKLDTDVDLRTLRNRERMREVRRAAKEAGVKVSGWDWWKVNPEKNAAKTKRWRTENPERWRDIQRGMRERKLATPWGRINNSLWSGIHAALKRVKVPRKNPGKYERALGYRYADLKAHLKEQFTSKMSFDNWGDVWEIDHIIPCSTFHYKSLDDPIFRECWALSNIRPLLTRHNRQKGAKR